MRSAEDMSVVRRLLSEGVSVPEVSRRSGVPVETVRRWATGGTKTFGTPPVVKQRPWRPPDPWSYAYLLGLYLGDGCVSPTRGTAMLRVALDIRYPEIILDCQVAMQLAMLHAKTRVYKLPHANAVHVQSSTRLWLDAFPQAGPGRKHSRRIELAPWQQKIVDAEPRSFLRGLIHSDGCRTVNRFKTKLPSGRVAEYEYPRYFFSNLSADIRELFCQTCDQIGVRWSQSNHRNISVSHRKSVAVLDEFIGPKA